MTAATRQQRKRDRIKSGLVRIEVWVPKKYEELIRDEIAHWLAGYERFDAKA